MWESCVCTTWKMFQEELHVCRIHRKWNLPCEYDLKAMTQRVRCWQLRSLCVVSQQFRFWSVRTLRFPSCSNKWAAACSCPRETQERIAGEKTWLQHWWVSRCWDNEHLKLLRSSLWIVFYHASKSIYSAFALNLHGKHFHGTAYVFFFGLLMYKNDIFNCKIWICSHLNLKLME